MTEEQEQTGGDWEKLPLPAGHPGPRRDDGENSADAEGGGSDRSPDLLQMLRAAESRRGAPHSQDQEPVAEAQRTDMVSWDANVARCCVRLCVCDRGSVNVQKLSETLMI